MNYVIICNMRSGSSYLGELLQLNGLKYYNELFTPEICRRSKIMPRELDDNISEKVIEEAFRYDDAGFKLIYGQSTPQIWARLVLKRNLKVIHIIRENLLQQFASIKYLEYAGVSKAVNTEEGVKCYGTDGLEAKQKTLRFQVSPDNLVQFFGNAEYWRRYTHESFSGSNYREIHFEQIFQDTSATELFNWVSGKNYIRLNRPDHVKTPRPKAADMIENYSELKGWFSSTPYARFFME